MRSCFNDKLAKVSKVSRVFIVLISMMLFCTLWLAKSHRFGFVEQSIQAQPAMTISAVADGWYTLGSSSASGGGISNNNTDTLHTSMTVLGDQIFVAWSDDTNGDSEIYVKRWNGSSWISAGSGSNTGGGVSNNNGDSRSPVLATAPNGTLYLSWDDDSGGDSEIYVKRWTGSSWTTVGSGSASGGGISKNNGNSRFAWLAFAPDNTPYITWEDDSSGNYEIYVKRWNGSSWIEVGSGSATGDGISQNSGPSRRPTIAVAPNNLPYVTWYDTTGMSIPEIYILKWNGSSWVDVGTDSATGVGISDTPTGFSQKPTVGITSDGTPYVAWRDDASGDNEIYVRRFYNATWEEVGANSASGGGISINPGDSNWPNMKVASNDDVYIAWHDDTHGNYEIYVKRWDGKSWQEVGLGSASGGGISSTSGTSVTPWLVAARGTSYVSWVEDMSDGDSETYFRFFVPKLYIPTILNNYCGGFAGPMENEPNDSNLQANGGLCSGFVYAGSPDDHNSSLDSDYYYINMTTAGTITIDVTKFLSIGQVQLYYQTTSDLKVNLPNEPSGNYHIEYNNAAPGLYYIRVVAPENHSTNNGDYNLQVTFP